MYIYRISFYQSAVFYSSFLIQLASERIHEQRIKNPSQRFEFIFCNNARDRDLLPIKGIFIRKDLFNGGFSGGIIETHPENKTQQ